MADSNSYKRAYLETTPTVTNDVRRCGAIPQLATLFDGLCTSELTTPQEKIEPKGVDNVVSSEFRLIEVLTVRGQAPWLDLFRFVGQGKAGMTHTEHRADAVSQRGLAWLCGDWPNQTAMSCAHFVA
jgi:hypothetical protein